MLCPLCHTEHSTSGCPQTGLGCITGGIKFPESIIKELPSRLEIAARIMAGQIAGVYSDKAMLNEFLTDSSRVSLLLSCVSA